MRPPHAWEGGVPRPGSGSRRRGCPSVKASDRPPAPAPPAEAPRHHVGPCCHLLLVLVGLPLGCTAAGPGCGHPATVRWGDVQESQRTVVGLPFSLLASSWGFPLGSREGDTGVWGKLSDDSGDVDLLAEPFQYPRSCGEPRRGPGAVGGAHLALRSRGGLSVPCGADPFLVGLPLSS